MCLDSGIFRCKYKKEKTYELTTYGFNMYSIETIKNHLYNLIPNIFILSDYMDSDYYCETYDGIGLVTINTKKFGKDIEKRTDDNKIRSHKAFILSKYLFHKLFGHTKSSFGKDYNKFYSPVCFKDKLENLRFLSNENDDNLFINLNDLNDLSKIIHSESTGDSGYFLEFFFGFINNEYTLNILEDIEDHTNLGILLDTNLWHKRISDFQKYVELKYYIINNSIDQEKINLDLNITEQINQMKNIIENIIEPDENKDDDVIVVAKNELMPKAPFPRIRKKRKINKRFNFFNE